MTRKRSHPDNHILDPFVKPMSSRWFLIIVTTVALMLGVFISIENKDWSWINRFGGVVIVTGLLFTMSPLFANGIYKSQSSAATLAGLHSDGTPLTTNSEDRRVGNNVALGIMITIFGTLINAFGDLVGGYFYGF